MRRWGNPDPAIRACAIDRPSGCKAHFCVRDTDRERARFAVIIIGLQNGTCNVNNSTEQTTCQHLPSEIKMTRSEIEARWRERSKRALRVEYAVETTVATTIEDYGNSRHTL